MSSTWVLLTGLPITKGHEDLIRYAGHFQAHQDGLELEYNVILAVKEDEPYIEHRYAALKQLGLDPKFNNDIKVHLHYNKFTEDPNAEGFWEYWKSVFYEYGFEEGDYIVGSEPYIFTLAEILHGRSVPYDTGRTMRPISGTMVRENPVGLFREISYSMRKQMQKKFVLFGAESTGKTTISRAAATAFGGVQTHEFARPYLEQFGPEHKLTADDMNTIWSGQKSLETSLSARDDTPFIWMDTDIVSTYGYYKLYPHLINERSEGLEFMREESELSSLGRKYFVLSSNIPFEPDILRYGGDVRESSDQFWIDILEDLNADYEYIETGDMKERLSIISEYANFNLLASYVREFND